MRLRFAALILGSFLVGRLTAVAAEAPAKDAQAPAKEAAPAPKPVAGETGKVTPPAKETAPAPKPVAIELGKVTAPPGAPKVSDPRAVAVVERYLKAIGGRDVLAKIKDRTSKMTNIKSQATGDQKVDIDLLMKDGICFREEWEIKDFPMGGKPIAFVQIYNGHLNEGWVHEKIMRTVSALDGKTLQVFVWDKQMDDFFCHWEQDGYTLTLAGEGVISKELAGQEEPCDIVQVTDFVGRQNMRFYFSKTTGLLLKKEWQEVGLGGGKAGIKREQYYQMYRDIPFMDGSGLSIKVPLRIAIYQDGDLDITRVSKAVLINSGISDKVFEKPEGEPFEDWVKKQKAEREKAKKDEGTEPSAPSAKTTHGGAGRAKPEIQKVTPLPPPTEVKTEEKKTP